MKFVSFLTSRMCWSRMCWKTSMVVLSVWMFASMFSISTKYSDKRRKAISYNEIKLKKQKFLQTYSYPLNIEPEVIFKSNITPINLHPFSYLLKAENMCVNVDGDNKSVSNSSSLVILVKSDVSNFALRQAIRDTWGNPISNGGIPLVFMLGFHEGVQYLIEKENSVHNDIVQESFIDSYRNNTYKTIMMFNWAATYCSDATTVLFTDDDQFINVKQLKKYLKANKYKPHLLSGLVVTFAMPFRDSSSKWCVSREEYPFDYWPDYLAGGAFIASMSVVKNMSSLFPFVKHLSIDDVYLGIVAKKLGFRLTQNTLIRNGKQFIHKLPFLISNHGYKTAEDMKRGQKILEDFGMNKKQTVDRGAKSSGCKNPS